MKIGMFSDSYLPYTSGVVRSIETFTTELTALGHEVFIFAPNYPNCQAEPGVYRFFSIPSPTYQGFSLAVPFSPGLYSKLKDLNLDIIHVHSPFLLGQVGARYARKLRVPLVFTYHTLYDQFVHYVPFIKKISKKIVRKVTTDFCNRCDRVIVPTKVIATHLKKTGVKVPISIIPTGIHIEEFKKADQTWLKANFNIPENKKILLFVGRLGQEKNISFLLDAYNIIIQNYPEVVFVLVGSGPDEKKIKAQAKLQTMPDQIIFTGLLSKADTIKSYAGADIFIFASLTETQGLVIAEAKAAGLPVVAVDAFGVSDMVVDGEDGYLCSLDINIFADSIKKILDNSLLYSKMKQAALENAEKISALNCTLKTINTYEEIITTYRGCAKSNKKEQREYV
ncbi:MAG: glycosyltransferase family 4 protein [Desulfotomaculum sp.]|nr:glycosyltransferase family 4 protein [Desulfotomaculum sp.]